ncbi:hypothetical protein XENOCAPTIV_000135 [Xenoophorus captivus]|uniref:Uncharacterized protein n=1 Tax=Xenoophorus captivus TaxID=1517983 RepID=A0ABV0S9I0_9TELE
MSPRKTEYVTRFAACYFSEIYSLEVCNSQKYQQNHYTGNNDSLKHTMHYLKLEVHMQHVHQQVKNCKLLFLTVSIATFLNAAELESWQVIVFCSESKAVCLLQILHPDHVVHILILDAAMEAARTTATH